MYTAEITVLNGLPVTIEFCVNGSDPEVGIFDDTIEDWEIVAISGKVCKKPPMWLYRRITNAGEDQKVVEKLFESFDDRGG